MRIRSASASPRGCSTPERASNSSPARSARRITSTSRASRCRAKCSTTPSPPTSSRELDLTAYRRLERRAWACSGTRARRARRRATCSCSTSPTYDRVVNRRLSLPPRQHRAGRRLGRLADRRRNGALRAHGVFAGGQRQRWISSRAWNTAPAAGGSALVARRYVSNRDGDMDTSFLLQLELNGLSSVGVGADTFLERSIRGYSVSPPER